MMVVHFITLRILIPISSLSICYPSIGLFDLLKVSRRYFLRFVLIPNTGFSTRNYYEREKLSIRGNQHTVTLGKILSHRGKKPPKTTRRGKPEANF